MERRKLTLSTGNPQVSSQRPEMSPWYLRYTGGGYGYNGGGGGNGFKAPTSLSGNNMQGLRSVSGRVYDANTGEPMIGASVVVKGTGVGASTDMDGNFTISNLPANYQGLVVNYVGYNNMETPITGPRLDVPLYENSEALSEVVVTGYATQKRKMERPSAAQPRPAMADKMSRSDSDGEADEYNAPLAEAEEKPTTITFSIEEPYTIPSDGKKQTVEIKMYEVPANYEYYAAPKLDPSAFLTAKVTDWEDLYLLSGNANLFFEGTYLGQAYLNLDNTLDTLTLSLGRDQNVKIERKRITDFAKRQLIGDKQTAKRAFDIEVRNTKRQAINITIEDQFPLTTDADISVSRDEASDGDIKDDTGYVTWKLKLAPNESKKWRFAYSVKYPKGRQLSVD